MTQLEKELKEQVQYYREVLQQIAGMDLEDVPEEHKRYADSYLLGRIQRKAMTASERWI